MLTLPFGIGKVKAFTVILPIPRGRWQTMSVVASPLHSESFVPKPETVAVKSAEVTSSSEVPVPVMVSVLPV
jgi:hypothetical protein